MLSGYVSKVRKEEKNTIYCIAGDMFRGSVIDSEFRGISTIEIMNMLAPDVVTIGNHEIDYGIAHLLFLEKCAKFPIVNVNLHITTNNARLFQSHHIIEIDGMRVVYDRANHEFNEFSLHNEPIEDEKIYKIGLQYFFYLNMKEIFSISHEEIAQNGKTRRVTTSCREVLDEYLSCHQNPNYDISGRLIIEFPEDAR